MLRMMVRLRQVMLHPRVASGRAMQPPSRDERFGSIDSSRSSIRRGSMSAHAAAASKPSVDDLSDEGLQAAIDAMYRGYKLFFGSFVRILRHPHVVALCDVTHRLWRQRFKTMVALRRRTRSSSIDAPNSPASGNPAMRRSESARGDAPQNSRPGKDRLLRSRAVRLTRKLQKGLARSPVCALRHALREYFDFALFHTDFVHALPLTALDGFDPCPMEAGAWDRLQCAMAMRHSAGRGRVRGVRHMSVLFDGKIVAGHDVPGMFDLYRHLRWHSAQLLRPIYRRSSPRGGASSSSSSNTSRRTMAPSSFPIPGHRRPNVGRRVPLQAVVEAQGGKVQRLWELGDAAHRAIVGRKLPEWTGWQAWWAEMCAPVDRSELSVVEGLQSTDSSDDAESTSTSSGESSEEEDDDDDGDEAPGVLEEEEEEGEEEGVGTILGIPLDSRGEMKDQEGRRQREKSTTKNDNSLRRGTKEGETGDAVEDRPESQKAKQQQLQQEQQREPSVSSKRSARRARRKAHPLHFSTRHLDRWLAQPGNQWSPHSDLDEWAWKHLEFQFHDAAQMSRDTTWTPVGGTPPRVDHFGMDHSFVVAPKIAVPSAPPTAAAASQSAAVGGFVGAPVRFPVLRVPPVPDSLLDELDTMIASMERTVERAQGDDARTTPTRSDSLSSDGRVIANEEKQSSSRGFTQVSRRIYLSDLVRQGVGPWYPPSLMDEEGAHDPSQWELFAPLVFPNEPVSDPMRVLWWQSGRLTVLLWVDAHYLDRADGDAAAWLRSVDRWLGKTLPPLDTALAADCDASQQRRTSDSFVQWDGRVRGMVQTGGLGPPVPLRGSWNWGALMLQLFMQWPRPFSTSFTHAVRILEARVRREQVARLGSGHPGWALPEGGSVDSPGNYRSLRQMEQALGWFRNDKGEWCRRKRDHRVPPGWLYWEQSRSGHVVLVRGIGERVIVMQLDEASPLNLAYGIIRSEQLLSSAFQELFL